MSQIPRWWRKALLEEKAGLRSQYAGYLDQQDASNRRKAVEEMLNQQEREYQATQRQNIERIKSGLRSFPAQSPPKREAEQE